jgi:glucose-6-phosphate 1-dehydrogenase
MNNDTDLLLFGAKGDLSIRKLYPALIQLDKAGLLPKGLRILALARAATSQEDYLTEIRTRIDEQTTDKICNDQEWKAFTQRITYIAVDFANQDAFAAVASQLSADRTRIFYLATPPGIFSTICENLSASKCLQGDFRVVLEKPIGHNLETCQEVNETLAKYFKEKSIYRIDHYLGKETVQNLLVLRFANRFINAQWDQSCIDHIQITVAETVGIGDRWPFYNPVGQLRDMVQNHLMQLLCLVAMEPPNNMGANGIRSEKLKIVRALRPFDKETVDEDTVRGQYTQGFYGSKMVPGYLEEEACQDADSNTETFVAIKAHIDNWRWAGVPFYLRTGKRMAEKLTEIVIAYKPLPHNIFGKTTYPNRLVIRLQPNEGIEMQMISKKPSLREKMSLVKQDLNLDFQGAGKSNRIPEAYERLLLDVIDGDQSLFVGREEVEESWRWCDSIISAWEEQDDKVKPYHCGSWGPTRADLLIERDDRKWHG